MKKLLPIIVLGVVTLGVILARKGNEQQTTNQQAATSQNTSSTSPADSAQNSGTSSTTSGSETKTSDANSELNTVEDEIKPAAELYASADAALAAVKAASKEYDDLVIEQFVEPDQACSWCNEFYAKLAETMTSDATNNDERSYFAEILAVSGKVDNVNTLVKAAEGAKDSEQKDAYAEALEMTVGDDEVVRYFSDHLGTEDSGLKESMLAAVTNHGSRLAVDVLYQETVKNDDPDGYYSIGIGLGEMIPDDDTIPYLQELASKRDKFSHLAVKALLNQGDKGLKTVVTMLEQGGDEAGNKQLLKDAVDHVAYEDTTSAYLEDLAKNSKNPVIVEFSKEALKEIDSADEDLDIDIQTEGAQSEASDVKTEG
jgi:hypothetical protein